MDRVRHRKFKHREEADLDVTPFMNLMIVLVPVLLLVFLSLYLVSYFGQKIGKKQMIILHRFFEASTGLNTNQ